MVLLEGKDVAYPPADGTSWLIVGIATIFLRMSGASAASLMSIMTMASHGRRVSLPSRCLRLRGEHV
jgi:hypothetical protein